MIAFDTHCHLQDTAFASDADEAVGRAMAAGVRGMTVCGYDPESNLAALALAARFAGAVFPAVGYHPHDAKDITPALLDELATLAARPEVVAIGEIGLDHYRDHSPHDRQEEILRAQLEIAITTRKPISVHSRGAEEAIYAALAAYAARSPLPSEGRPVGVMHCFGGTLAQALRYVELGFAVSVACAITYPKNDEARKIAAGLRLDALVVETDSPYLPPQPIRGRRNEPAHVVSAIEAIAAARGVPAICVATSTTANAARLFGVTISPAAEAGR